MARPSKFKLPTKCLVLVLLILSSGTLCRANAEVGDRVRLGSPGEWKNTIAATMHNNRLYTVEKTGVLYETDLAVGRWRQLGKPEFVNTRFILGAGNFLYTIEADGTFYKVNPVDGAWTRVGQEGAWKNTIAGTSMNNRIYTIETSGALYETIPETGVWKQLGKPEFSNTRYLINAANALFTIENGGLYQVNPLDGSWSSVGKPEDWRGTRAVTVLNGRLFSANNDGRLYESRLTHGTWVAVGKPTFAQTQFIFAADNKLFTIDTDGSLYVIQVS